MKKTFNVKGMHCNSCTRIIEEALDDKGYFELIIWSSYERNLRNGLWNIKFLYNDNSPIKCSNDDCLFKIVKK